jgi:hypothetical protein
MMSNIRAARHAIRDSVSEAFTILAGRPGLTADQQASNLTRAAEVLREAANLAEQAAKTAAERDLDAHKAAKQAAVPADAPEGTIALPNPDGSDGFSFFVETNGGYIPLDTYVAYVGTGIAEAAASLD